jgi:hypothetical protein
MQDRSSKVTVNSPISLIILSITIRSVLLVAGQLVLLVKYLQAGGAGEDVGHTGSDGASPADAIHST